MFSCELVPTYSFSLTSDVDPFLVESSIYSLGHIFVPSLDSLMLTRALHLFNGVDILVEALEHTGVLHVHRVLYALRFCVSGIGKVLILLMFTFLTLLSVFQMFHPFDLGLKLEHSLRDIMDS